MFESFYVARCECIDVAVIDVEILDDSIISHRCDVTLFNCAEYVCSVVL